LKDDLTQRHILQRITSDSSQGIKYYDALGGALSYLREEIKAGIIIISSLVILSMFVILIGGSQFLKEFDKYYVRVKNAGGLEEGAQVRLGGVRVGRVLYIKAPHNPEEPVTIEIGLKKGTTLYKGTKALITQIGFVGDIYLLLSIERTTNERLNVGDVIPSDEPVQFTLIMARLNDISQSVDNLIKDINKLFSKGNLENIERLIQNTDKAIASSSSNLDRITLALKGTTDKLDSVLVEIEGLVKENKGEVSQLIKRARESIEKAGDMVKAIEETSRTVGKTVRSVDKTIEQQSQNIDNLLTILTETTEDLQEAVQEIKNKPWSILYKEGKPIGE
jgi:ABC-type transporter Mla subunit MlaD